MKLFQLAKWLIVVVVLVLMAHVLIRVLESTLVSFFGVMKSIAEFSRSSMTASGLEVLSPQIPQY